MKFVPVLAALAALALSSSALAANIRVPQDQPTLAAAISAAQPNDRIILSRGAHDGGTFDLTNVEIVGRGAVVRGHLEITGDRVGLFGLTFHDGGLTVTGSTPRVQRCRFKGAPVRLVGDQAAIIRSRIVSPGDVGVEIVGSHGLIRKVRASDLRAAQMLLVRGDHGVVQDCTVSGVYAAPIGLPAYPDPGHPEAGVAIRIVGDNGSALTNRVRRSSGGIWVTGDNVAVEDNSLVTRGSPGVGTTTGSVSIVVTTTEPAGETSPNRVADNRLRLDHGVGIRVLGSGGLAVVDNRVHARRARTAAIDIRADDNVVQDNRSSGRRRAAMRSNVLGDRNEVVDNVLSNLTVTGEDNIVNGNTER